MRYHSQSHALLRRWSRDASRQHRNNFIKEIRVWLRPTLKDGGSHGVRRVTFRKKGGRIWLTASFKFTSLSLNVAFPAAIFLMKSVFDPCNFTRGGWLLHRHRLFRVSQLFIEISKDSLKRGSLCCVCAPNPQNNVRRQTRHWRRGVQGLCDVRPYGASKVWCQSWWNCS